MKTIFPIPDNTNCFTIHLSAKGPQVTAGLRLADGNASLAGLPDFRLLESSLPTIVGRSMTYAHTRSSVAGRDVWEQSAFYAAMGAPWRDCDAAIVRLDETRNSKVTTIRIWDSVQLIETAEHAGGLAVGSDEIFCVSLVDGRKFLLLAEDGTLVRAVTAEREVTRSVARRLRQSGARTRAACAAVDAGQALLQRMDEILLGLISGT